MRHWIVGIVAFTGVVLFGQQAWANTVNPADGPFVIKYGFNKHQPNPDPGFTPMTSEQQAQTLRAFDVWAAATDVGFGPNLIFVPTTPYPNGDNDFIYVSNKFFANNNFLGSGGGQMIHGPVADGSPFLGISGSASTNNSKNWNTTHDNAMGGFDYFSVMASEIGHALRLGHTNGTADIMNASYTGTRNELSPTDIAAVRAIWGVGALVVPEPSSLVLLALGFIMMGALGWRARRRVKQV